MRRWGIVIALLGVAAVVRASVMMYEFLSGDDARIALMARHILTGENFPVFMYWQTYMGSLIGAHLVPALFLFGFSPLVVRVNAIMYSLLFPLGLYVLGRRLFDETTARAALLFAAVPPFLLSYWSTLATPHLEANTFGVVLLLLAMAAMDADNATRYRRVLLGLGLTAGVALWTNVKVIEVLLPACLVLWVRNPWLPVSRAGVLSAGAFIAGSSPTWLFHLLRGDPAKGQPGTMARFFDLEMGFSVARAIEVVTTTLPPVLGTYYWSVGTAVREAAFRVNAAVYAVGTVVVAAGMVRQVIRGGMRPVRPWGHLLLLLTLAAPLAMLYAYRAWPVNEESARYILPVYIPLFLFAGALVARAWRRWRLAGIALVTFLLVFNLWTNLAFMWPLDAAERASRAKHMADRQALVQLLDAERIEALYLDNHHVTAQFAFLLENVVASTLFDEVYPPNAVRADAAERVAILARGAGPAIERSLEAAGIRFRARSTPFGRLYTDFDLESLLAYREISPGGWRPSAFPHPELAQHAIDRDVGTEWESQEFRREGMWFQVDLGQIHRVAMVAWLPGGSEDAPTGFRLEASRDGAQWTVLREVPAYFGPVFWSGGRPIARVRWARVEVRFPPVKARYLRVTHLGEARWLWWTIREFFVYEDGGSVSYPRWTPKTGQSWTPENRPVR
ncbi:MAG: discoidin domain-containing protein [Candidatus Rokubacteria bacterium]|nr:discoidin domain-containing protein [Candidatus Rokubacteria bacterium]